MPEQSALIWNIILTGVVGSFFWWVRGMSQSITDIRQQISNTREEVAKTYVTKPEVEVSLGRILERFLDYGHLQGTDWERIKGRQGQAQGPHRHVGVQEGQAA